MCSKRRRVMGREAQLCKHQELHFYLLNEGCYKLPVQHSGIRKKGHRAECACALYSRYEQTFRTLLSSENVAPAGCQAKYRSPTDRGSCRWSPTYCGKPLFKFQAGDTFECHKSVNIEVAVDIMRGALGLMSTTLKCTFLWSNKRLNCPPPKKIWFSTKGLHVSMTAICLKAQSLHNGPCERVACLISVTCAKINNHLPESSGFLLKGG